MKKLLALALALGLSLGACASVSRADTSAAPVAPATHTFAIGKDSFLLDGKPFVIRCGEIHFARIPREYWRDRLERCKAMGLNTVCVYLFWNYHEWNEGSYDWSGQADAAEFCRIAQQEGLWVILRPGPYACAEWEMGGLPWWLLKNNGIHLRSTDPRFMTPAKAWLKEVGRVLGPEQITAGGPVLMVQVENEYGFFGNDPGYLRQLRQATIDSGFNVPLFACNPVSQIPKGSIPELFNVVNFGADPQDAFKTLRQIQPEGPLMAGEYYSGWFDSWGAPHHRGNTDGYLKDLDYMLRHHESFSIYMADGGTSFGLWSGADRPFKPDTSSYDYDAPIGEDGSLGAKFERTRALMSRYLQPGETLPPVPPAPKLVAIPSFTLAQFAPLFANLPAPRADTAPRAMEAYGQGRGCILYRATLPAGPALALKAGDVHDFATVFVDGTIVGRMDRRFHAVSVSIPARAKASTLDILVDTMGRINFGAEVADHKGLIGPVQFIGGDAKAPTSWQVYNIDLSDASLAALHFLPANAKIPAGTPAAPAYWRGSFEVDAPADTFLDVSHWGKGVAWINGHCLGRFWNIGPTQTMYVPGPWLKKGANEVVVFDLEGPDSPVLSGRVTPIYDELRPDKDLRPASTAAKGRLTMQTVAPCYAGAFQNNTAAQTVMFEKPVTGRQFCFEMRSSQDGGPFAVIAELDLLDANGQSLPHNGWTIAYVDSEEKSAEDGSALNAIDGQTASYWHSSWSQRKDPYPHTLVIDLGAPVAIGGLRYTPRAGQQLAGRVKDYQIYIGDNLVAPATKP